MRLAAIAIAVLIAGCASSKHEERESLLAEPIDCSVAEQDIAALEAAMPSRRERARSAVQSVTPVGALTGIVTGSYRDRTAVLTGRTSDELNARIEAIQDNCGIPNTANDGNQ